MSDDSDLLFVEDAESVDLHKDIEINVGDFIFKFKILEILGKNVNILYSFIIKDIILLKKK